MKIGYQGIKGAYSYVAALKLYPKGKLKGFGNFSDIFDTLKKKEIHRAVLPIENTLIGSINEVYDLIFDYGYKINGETSLKIDHNLLGIKGARLEDIKKVYSHPKALEQCSDFFKANPNIEPIDYEDTAAAAGYVSIKQDKALAAIASSAAGDLYGLKVLKPRIQTNKDNFTRFVVIEPKNNKKTGNKTSLVLATSHRSGSLLTCLQLFASENLNLTHIESRPLIGQPWNYKFYLDFEHPNRKDIVEKVIASLKSHTQFVHRLGTYKKVERKLKD